MLGRGAHGHAAALPALARNQEQALAALEHNQEVAVELLLQLADALDVDDRRAVDAQELLGIEPVLEPGSTETEMARFL